MTTPALTPDEVALVEQSFAMIRPMKGQAAGMFYRRLFEIAPRTEPLFADANMTRQSLRFMATLNLAVGSLRHAEVLRALGAELGARHAGYGVEPRHYAPFGEALAWMLEQGLGPAFDDETRAAWAAAFDALSGAMIAGAATADATAAE